MWFGLFVRWVGFDFGVLFCFNLKSIVQESTCPSSVRTQIPKAPIKPGVGAMLESQDTRGCLGGKGRRIPDACELALLGY